MTPRIGLLLFTALLMQCENPVETPVLRGGRLFSGSRIRRVEHLLNGLFRLADGVALVDDVAPELDLLVLVFEGEKYLGMPYADKGIAQHVLNRLRHEITFSSKAEFIRILELLGQDEWPDSK